MEKSMEEKKHGAALIDKILLLEAFFMPPIIYIIITEVAEFEWWMGMIAAIVMLKGSLFARYILRQQWKKQGLLVDARDTQSSNSSISR